MSICPSCNKDWHHNWTICRLESENSRLRSDNEALRKQVERMREAVQPLIGIAESHIMQTYDRSGTTRKAIEEMEQALDELDGKGAGE